MNAPSGGSVRIPQLDGLRGIAILLVISLHYLNDTQHGAFGTLLYRFGCAFRMGWAGVDLFFVLSGFLIGGILLEARESANYFRTFYLRRFFRILPIYYLWLALFALAAFYAGPSIGGVYANPPSTTNVLPVFFLFLQNYVALPFGSFAWLWLAVAWSLGVEEQFYLVSPPLVRFFSVKRLKQVLVATLLLTPLFRLAVYTLWSHGSDAIYVWMPCRADSLAMGMLAALLWREGRIHAWYSAHRSKFCALLIVLLLPIPLFIKWLFSPLQFWMGFLGYSWLALLFACLLVQCLLEPQGRWSHFLQVAFLREMGRLSYCIYLIHLLILGLCHSLILHKLPAINSGLGALVTLLAFCLSYLLAALSWRFFEHPLVRLGHRYHYKSEPSAELKLASGEILVQD
jgi:peptidoglycan/LPS O-acetylase OafA/YrhL